MIEGVQDEQRWPLAKVDVLEGLTPEEVERLALLSASVNLEAGETFALVDEDRRALLLLASGRVRVQEPNAAGPGLTISMVEDRTVVVQTGSAPQRSRALRVEALESSVLRLAREDFDDLVRRNPEVGVKMIRLLSERLAVCASRLSDLIRKEVPARLAGLILGLSEYQGVLTVDGSRRIPTRYTHQQLASMVGSNREALTKAFGRLKKAGAVEVRDRHIYVTDADALERLAEAER